MNIDIDRKIGRICAQRQRLLRMQASLLLLALFGFCSQRAIAKPEFPPVVQSAYPLKSGGVIAKAVDACTLCHAEAGPPELNPYGKDVRAALKAANTKMLTPQILHSIDNKDSDGDGASNGAEFAADTLPGDPKSKPAGSTTNSAGSNSPSSQSSSSQSEAPSNSLVTSIIGLMFPKHAQHPVIVHLPIGVFIIGLLFDVLALLRKDRNLTLAGYYNLTAAAITSLLAVATGLLAWWFAFGHSALQGTLLYHLILGLVTSGLIWLLWWMRFRSSDKGAPLSRAYMVIAVIAFMVISITGHLGGTLSG